MEGWIGGDGMSVEGRWVHQEGNEGSWKEIEYVMGPEVNGMWVGEVKEMWVQWWWAWDAMGQLAVNQSNQGVHRSHSSHTSATSNYRNNITGSCEPIMCLVDGSMRVVVVAQCQ